MLFSRLNKAKERGLLDGVGSEAVTETCKSNRVLLGNLQIMCLMSFIYQPNKSSGDFAVNEVVAVIVEFRLKKFAMETSTKPAVGITIH